jgi:predicted GNAT family N-acyltransferase
MIKWQWAEFTHLSSEELYQITQARQDVFIVE